MSIQDSCLPELQTNQRLLEKEKALGQTFLPVSNVIKFLELELDTLSILILDMRRAVQ
jgi:hypothetical protein